MRDLLFLLIGFAAATLFRGNSSNAMLPQKLAEPVPDPRSDSNHIRRWLTRNKVFFEVFGQGLAVTALTAASVYVAWQAKEATALQNQLTKVQGYPNLLLKIEGQDLGEDVGAIELLTILNEGGPIRYFDYKAYVFMEVVWYERTEDDDFGPRRTSLVPLHYYVNRSPEPALTGRLAVLSGRGTWGGNRQRASRILREFRMLVEERDNPRLVTVDLQRYVNVTYCDRWNDPHDETYRVSPLLPNALMDPADRDTIQRLYWRIQSPDVATMTPEDVYGAWKAIVAQQMSAPPTADSASTRNDPGRRCA